MPSLSLFFWRPCGMCYIRGLETQNRAIRTGSSTGLRRNWRARVVTHIVVSEFKLSRTNRLDNRQVVVIAHGLCRASMAQRNTSGKGDHHGLPYSQFRWTPPTRPPSLTLNTTPAPHPRHPASLFDQAPRKLWMC